MSAKSSAIKHIATTDEESVQYEACEYTQYKSSYFTVQQAHSEGEGGHSDPMTLDDHEENVEFQKLLFHIGNTGVGNKSADEINEQYVLADKFHHLLTMKSGFNGSTPLTMAIKANNDVIAGKIVRYLHGVVVDGQPAIDIKDKIGNTALHIAAERGKPQLVATLINGGADMIVENEYKMTPLHLAVEKNHEYTLQILLDFATIHLEKFQKPIVDGFKAPFWLKDGGSKDTYPALRLKKEIEIDENEALVR